MTKIAFAVLAHRNPRQLGRLVAALGPGRTVVHLDARLRPNAFTDLARASAPARLVRRHRSAWASWGIAAAICSGFAEAVDDTSVTHVAVLSGQDLPLVPVGHMESLLPIGISFVRTFPLPQEFLGGRGGLDRLEDLNTPLRGRRLRIPARRRLPGGLTGFGASQWSIFARPHIASILEHARRYEQWWRWAWMPEEFLFASVLGTRHPRVLLDANPGYTEWTPGQAHPRTFSCADVPRLLAVADRDVGRPPGRNWFARKFDDEDGRLSGLLQSGLAGVRLDDTPLSTIADVGIGMTNALLSD